MNLEVKFIFSKI